VAYVDLSLSQIHFLYQFSLQFFLEIFSCVLSANNHLSGVTNYASRLSIIITDLFQVSTRRLTVSDVGPWEM